MSKPMILLSAGGTGGHVFPARALAEELKARDCRVAFITDTRGLKYLDGLSDPIHVLPLASTVGGVKAKTRFVVSLLRSYTKAHKLVGALKPSAVIGFGGYPSAPALFAAQHRMIPTILHEQNAILGLANILLAPLARKIALSHRGTKGLKPGWSEKSVFTGNPVRADIIALHDKLYPELTDTLNLLIFGGSLGAKSFADIIPHSIIALAKEVQLKLQVTHQARAEDIDKVRQAYNAAGLDADIKPFFDNIPERIEKAHLMICRSGASTISETTCAGRPAVYIPYPWHKDQQQLHNARCVAEVGGGWIIEEKFLTVESLHRKLSDIVTSEGALADAAFHARSLGTPDAASMLADQVMSIL